LIIFIYSLSFSLKAWLTTVWIYKILLWKVLRKYISGCTIAFEVGIQNGGLASGLALQMGKIATVGLAPAIFGPLMNITGSMLANWWRGRPIKEGNTGQSNNSDKE
jgi:predicted Na+-dependent transporter